MPTGPDTSHSGQTKIYLKQQPAGTTFNGNAITTEEVSDVGSLQSQYGVQSLNGVALPQKVSFAIAPGAANICIVTITVTDNGGQPVTGYPFDFDLCLSDAANGVGLTAATASGAVQQGVNGTVLSTYTAKKALYVQTNGSGVFNLSITDTVKTGFFVMAQTPGGLPSVSRQLVTGDYG